MNKVIRILNTLHGLITLFFMMFGVYLFCGMMFYTTKNWFFIYFSILFIILDFTKHFYLKSKGFKVNSNTLTYQKEK
jgi:hypothetical protein